MRWLAFVLFLFVALIGVSYLAAGRTTPATVVIEQPTGPIGTSGVLQFTAGAARSFFTRLDATLEQNGRTYPLYSVAEPGAATLKHLDAEHLQVLSLIHI